MTHAPKPGAECRLRYETSAEASLASSQASAAPFRLVKGLAESAAESARLLRATELGEGARCGKPSWPPGAPGRPIFRRVDPKLPTIELEVVERRDGVLSRFIRRELDECKAPRSAGLPVRSDVHAHHLPRRCERLAQTILGRVEAQIADEYFSWNG